VSEAELAEHLRKAISSFARDYPNESEVLCRIASRLSDHDLVVVGSTISRRAFDPAAWQDLMNEIDKIKDGTNE
jgi:hypothetical protein